MTYFDVEQKITTPRVEKKSHANTLGSIIMICGFILTTWYVTDTILISQGFRILIFNAVISLSRLVIGVLFIFAGIVTKKNEDWQTIKP